MESVEVVLEAGDDSFVSGSFRSPASFGGVVAQGADVVELSGDGWDELAVGAKFEQVSQMFA